MSFSESSLLKKFQELNNTQQSVQTLSLWVIHHRKHSKIIVGTWLKELMSTQKADRKLTFLYLANDILQNSRKKGNEYLKEFSNIMIEAVENIAKYSDDKTRFTVERILNIWKDRKIYSDESIDKFRNKLHATKPLEIIDSPPLKDSPRNKLTKNENLSSRKRGHSTEDSIEPNLKSNKTSLREEVNKELAQSCTNIQVPEPSDLINLLQELEKSASSDAVVREKIAELPGKVSDINEIKRIKEKNEALELSKTVNDALQLLENYNSRLQQELVSRKQTALQLAVYIRKERSELENDQKMIDEWQKKLKQVNIVKKELQTHLESLPDLSSIEEAAELIPLPSAGDLFSN